MARRRPGRLPPAAWAAEAAGTALLVFDALSVIAFTMAPAAPSRSWPPELRLLVIGLVVGGTVAVFAITPAGKRSGAHLNPAVSLLLALRGALSVRDGPVYPVAQLTGSVVGVLAARLCWGSRMRSVADGLIQPGPGVGAGGALIGETLSTVVLLLVLSWLVSKPRPRETPWVIGALIAVLISATGATSGGSFNPARNFGPHILRTSHDSEHLGVGEVGQLVHVLKRVMHDPERGSGPIGDLARGETRWPLLNN